MAVLKHNITYITNCGILFSIDIHLKNIQDEAKKYVSYKKRVHSFDP